MKVTLEFDGAEEQEDIDNALNGYKWKLAVWDIDQTLRGTIKHDVSVLGGSPSEIEYEIAEKYRELLREILENYKINLE